MERSIFDVSDILYNFILCGKLKLTDIAFEDRIRFRTLYICEHKYKRHFQNEAEINEYKDFLRLILSDVGKATDVRIKDRLFDLYGRYKADGEINGVVFEGFP